MAKRSVILNHLEDKINIVVGDIKEADSLFQAASFDVVTCNPPYMIDTHGLINPDAPKAIARHEILCTLDALYETPLKLLKPNGSFLWCIAHSALQKLLPQ